MVCWAELVLTWGSVGAVVLLLARVEAWSACKKTLDWAAQRDPVLEVLVHTLLYEMRQTELFHTCILVIFLLACQSVKFQLCLEPEETRGSNGL